MNQPINLEEYKPHAVFYDSAEGARNATPEFMAKAREAVCNETIKSHTGLSISY